ncbi:MAG: hypothetical protein E7542_02835 [Ruminococcaceae bacterium]|nr:hypothetical protein [Oscillospiraceae bacterium]
MITLVNQLPFINSLSAEAVKLNCLYESYKDDSSVMFWIQNDNNAFIAMTDGNMIIYANEPDFDELSHFVSVLNPACVFSDLETLKQIGKAPRENINIMYRKADIEGESVSDNLSSKELYRLLDVDGLSLPEYPYFAVDYCKRLNHGFAKYFAIKDKCAVITFNCGDYAIINGLASHQKGYGSIALKGILQKNYGKHFLVCCRDSVKGFYQKNGFKKLYNAGYWVKNDEC